MSLLVLLLFALPVSSQDVPTLFPRLRRLSLEEVRALARSRSANIALSDARLAQASASRRDIERRIRLDTTGGLDPFSRQVRFYISLDLERLLGLNRQERERARQVEAEGRIGQTTAQADALRRVTLAWYGTLQAQNAVMSATRVRQTTAALFLAADARFKSGQGELGAVLGALRAREEGEDAYERAARRRARVPRSGAGVRLCKRRGNGGRVMNSNLSHTLIQSTPNTADFQSELQQATRVLREAIAATQAAIQGLEILLEPAPDVSLRKDTSLEPAPEPSPDVRSPKRYYIHDGEKPRLCRGCGATIFWATTPREKKMPVNPDGTSHWESCTERGLFKTEDF